MFAYDDENKFLVLDDGADFDIYNIDDSDSEK